MANKLKPATVIEEMVFTGTQTVAARRLFKDGNHKLKLTVCSDSYKSQCYARAEIWDPNNLKWNKVYSIPYDKMLTPESLCYYPDGAGKNISHFCVDLDYLLAAVREIIY